MGRRTEGLGERHRKIMEFLTLFLEKSGYAPSIRQIGDNIGVKSTSLVDYYLNQLVEMGYIMREDRISRSIRVLRPVHAGSVRPGQVTETVLGTARNMLSVPVWGRIVASAPLPMPSSEAGYFDPESSIEIARSLLPARENVNDLYALEVQGESMVDAMINDGDIVIMKRAQEANNGEMVAVWLDDENATTLKYFYREAGRVRLQPANPTMQPIYVNNPASLRIMGKVLMVIRQVKTFAA